MANFIILGNHFKNNGTCGLGGWYYSSLLDNKISNNVIDRSLYDFFYYRVGGLRPAGWDNLSRQYFSGDTAVYFENNEFDSNKFINPIAIPGSVFPAASMWIYNRMGYNGDPSAHNGDTDANNARIRPRPTSC